MSAPEIAVKYVAHLARLALTLEEEKKLSAQLSQILGYIEKLKQLDVSHVEPTAHAFPLTNVTRPAAPRPQPRTVCALCRRLWSERRHTPENAPPRRKGPVRWSRSQTDGSERRTI